MSLTEILLGVNCLLLLAVLLLLISQRGTSKEGDAMRRELREASLLLKKDLSASLSELSKNNLQAVELLGNALSKAQSAGQEQQARELAHLTDKLLLLQKSLAGSMEALRQENEQKLAEMRATVDEKLQSTLEKRLSESFRSVSERLEEVHRGLGEMQTLAGDVGGLKKILSGVKTRGILGEIQLGAILEEILPPGSYETNVETVRGSGKRVEFAIRLPGHGDAPVLLPIDAKFPGDRYAQLQDARESGDKSAIEAACRELEAVLRSEARDIKEKYLSPPETTPFGIMFLPFEGLYLEAVNRGMVEKLQREYNVSLTGPSTMAAFLNSLQTGFKTLALQQRSNEVWEVLAAVKTEFGKFSDCLTKMRKNLSSTSQSLDELLGARTKKMQLRLKAVEELDEERAHKLLGLDEE